MPDLIVWAAVAVNLVFAGLCWAVWPWTTYPFVDPKEEGDA